MFNRHRSIASSAFEAALTEINDANKKPEAKILRIDMGMKVLYYVRSKTTLYCVNMI